MAPQGDARVVTASVRNTTQSLFYHNCCYYGFGTGELWQENTSLPQPEWKLHHFIPVWNNLQASKRLRDKACSSLWSRNKWCSLMIKIALTELVTGTTLSTATSLNNPNTCNFFLYLSIRDWLVNKVTGLIMAVKLSFSIFLKDLSMLFNSYSNLRNCFRARILTLSF